MTQIGKPERATQDRLIALFRDELCYRYLGDGSDRDGNSKIEESLLTAHLEKSGDSRAQVNQAVHWLRTEADHTSARSTAERRQNGAINRSERGTGPPIVASDNARGAGR